MAQTHTIEVPIQGMDCADCAMHVEHALRELPGVQRVQVLLGAEKAVLQTNPGGVALDDIRKAVKDAGYQVPDSYQGGKASDIPGAAQAAGFARQALGLFGLVFGVVLFVVVVGEWLGLFETLTNSIPWPIGWAAVLVAGYPVFINVIRAALRRQVIAHTLMTVGVLAALAVGEWATAAVVVFFMRVGDYAERFTTERARKAVRDLSALAPQTARLLRQGEEVSISVEQVQPGDIVIIRPGEQIPVDGEVVSGQATVNQASLTGESLPVETGPGAQVYAATLAQLGSLQVRATAVGRDSTFGRVIRMVEEAEANRANVQRVADVFSAYYLPVVAGVALLTFLLRRDPLATAAVLVVACSCSFALATPIAVLASVGAAARRGLLIKGGKYLESLARADVLLVDKTGTLTLGQPEIQTIQPAEGITADELLLLAASAERYSEHPLAEAVRRAARNRDLRLREPGEFSAQPGSGVTARVEGHVIRVGRRQVNAGSVLEEAAARLEAEGKTLLWVERDGTILGVLAAADSLRPEVPQALERTRTLGIRKIELLTGDNPQTAAGLAGPLGIEYRADLLPDDKIRIVKEYQAKGHTVVMVGDGVNDAPALAQADIGIAMGTAGRTVAVEAAHIALLRDDWRLVPEALHIAQRTMRVVKGNLAFTTLYNLVGLSLAALGFLPPIVAAAAQSLPDLGILGNSARLLKQ